MRHIVKVLGVQLFEYEVKYDPSELMYSNTGGQFELQEIDTDDEEYEEDRGFGFGGVR